MLDAAAFRQADRSAWREFSMMAGKPFTITNIHARVDARLAKLCLKTRNLVATSGAVWRRYPLLYGRLYAGYALRCGLLMDLRYC